MPIPLKTRDTFSQKKPEQLSKSYNESDSVTNKTTLCRCGPLYGSHENSFSNVQSVGTPT